MSKAIEFLERLGRDAQLRYATRAEVAAELARAGIEPALRWAILCADQRVLEAMLGATPNVCCAIHAPDTPDERTRKPDDNKPLEKPAEKPAKDAKSQAYAMDCPA